MGWLKQESAYEKRMRELEEEADRVRKNMNVLMKNMNQESMQTRAATTSGRPSSPAIARSAYPSFMEDGMNQNGVNNDANEDADSSQERDSSTYSHSSKGVTRGAGVMKPENLANYLASGSFGKSGPITRERKMQRNKAIFMLVCALIALFSLYVWFN
ncbi:MAG TPA: hypothetical protein PJ991_09065 [Kiritimatiellia bacterium]|nr:hypothetical protein [Kiritimatiellia bacterium]